MHRLTFSIATLLAAGCSCGTDPLVDRDVGPDVATADAPRDDTPRDGGPDAGSCRTESPTPPTDPLAGDWVARFANPGVGGGLPNVEAFALGAGDVVYIGGKFSTAGYAPALNVASWDATGGWHALGTGLPGSVRSLATAPDGSLWAAHGTADDATPNRLSRWDGATWTEVATSEGPIQTITFVGDVLYAGGSFTRIGGLDTYALARFDGTTWSGWSGLRLNEGEAIEAISATGPDDVCVGGSFTTLRSIDARQAACWDGAAWHARSLPLEGYVYVLARDPADGTLVAGGEFMLDTSGTTGGSVARWRGDRWELVGGGVMSELGPGTTRRVRGIGFVDGEMFVAGAFTHVDPADPRAAHGVARWDGTRWDDLGGVFAEVGFILPSDLVWGLGVGTDGSLYLGGFFTRADSVRVGHVVRWDGTYFSALGTPGERYHGGVSGRVNALAREGTCAIYVGGDFDYAGDVRANNVARLTAEGYEALGEGVQGRIATLAVTDDGAVVAGGDFVPWTGADFRNIAIWDGVRWDGLGAGFEGVVWDVAVERPAIDEPSVIYAAGSMTTSGSTVVHGIARWSGGAWEDLGAGLLGHPLEFDPTMRTPPTLYEVVVDAETGDVIVAGNFASIGVGPDAITANNIARWDGARWHAYGPGLGGPDSSVLGLAFLEGDLVAVGSFALASSPVRAARWDGSAWTALGTGGPTTTSLVAVEPVGSGLFVGGLIEVDGTARHVAFFDGSTWSLLPDGGVSDLVETLSSTDEGLYVGGFFDRAGTIPSVGLALLGYED